MPLIVIKLLTGHIIAPFNSTFKLVIGVMVFINQGDSILIYIELKRPLLKRHQGFDVFQGNSIGKIATNGQDVTQGFAPCRQTLGYTLK